MPESLPTLIRQFTKAIFSGWVAPFPLWCQDNKKWITYLLGNIDSIIDKLLQQRYHYAFLSIIHHQLPSPFVKTYLLSFIFIAGINIVNSWNMTHIKLEYFFTSHLQICLNWIILTDTRPQGMLPLLINTLVL